VGAVWEGEAVGAAAEAVLANIDGAPPIRIGTMIEVPRAALSAGQIAHASVSPQGPCYACAQKRMRQLTLYTMLREGNNLHCLGRRMPHLQTPKRTTT
jgi:hypothetical protein